MERSCSFAYMKRWMRVSDDTTWRSHLVRTQIDCTRRRRLHLAQAARSRAPMQTAACPLPRPSCHRRPWNWPRRVASASPNNSAPGSSPSSPSSSIPSPSEPSPSSTSPPPIPNPLPSYKTPRARTAPARTSMFRSLQIATSFHPSTYSVYHSWNRVCMCH